MNLLLALIATFATPESTIQGTVRAAGSLEPIPYAIISVSELRRVVRADQKGYFVVSSIPRGQWSIEASAPGYAANVVTIGSSGSGVVRLDFELEVRPIELRSLEVDAEPASAGVTSSTPAAAGPPGARLDGPTLKLVPGLVEADVLRALQVLPAVAAMSDFSSALYVRGGSADQNLITLDGVPLFNPYHVGGVFSAIGADAVSTVDVWPGAFPAREGDRVSGVVHIHTRDGGHDEIRAAGAIGLLSTHATVDGPLPGGGGTFLFTGRRTYLDVASRAAHAIGVIPFEIPYGFSDAYVKLTQPTGALGSLTISGYIDGESFRPSGRLLETGEMDFAWGSRMLAAAWRQPVARNLLLEARAAYSGFYGDFDSSEYRGGPFECGASFCGEPAPPADTVPVLTARTRVRDVLASIDLSRFGSAHTLRAGVQLDSYLFDHALDVRDDVAPDLLEPFERVDRPRTLAAYIEDEWSASRSLELRAGLRMLEAGELGRSWMPRLGARWQAGRSLAFSAGAGRYAQVMRTLRNDESVASSLIAYDLLAAQPAQVGLATGEDIVLGAEWNTASTRIRTEVYARRLANLIIARELVDPLNAPIVITDRYDVAKGSTLGLEIMASRRVGIAELGFSYALTFARRRAGDESFTPRFERRHLADASALLPLGRSGLLSTRLALGTGQPYTPVIGATPGFIYDPVTRKWRSLDGAADPIPGDHNSARLPGYLRLDIAARKSFDKRWFGRHGTLSPYFQVLNALNTRNVLIADATLEQGELNYLPQLPFLPSFGIEWRF